MNRILLCSFIFYISACTTFPVVNKHASYVSVECNRELPFKVRTARVMVTINGNSWDLDRPFSTVYIEEGLVQGLMSNGIRIIENSNADAYVEIVSNSKKLEVENKEKMNLNLKDFGGVEKNSSKKENKYYVSEVSVKVYGEVKYNHMILCSASFSQKITNENEKEMSASEIGKLIGESIGSRIK